MPPRRPSPGAITVRSHLYLAPGIELQIAPDEASLSPEDIRALVKEIMACVEKLLNKKTEDGN